MPQRSWLLSRIGPVYVTPFDDDHAAHLLNIRGNPPSLPPHRSSLRNRKPQTDRPRSYVPPRRGYPTTVVVFADG
jgi:hypothetical protein